MGPGEQAKMAKPASEHGAGNEGVQHERGDAAAEQCVGPGEQAKVAKLASEDGAATNTLDQPDVHAWID